MHLSSIRLDSPVELVVVAVLAVLAIIAVPWFWDRWRKHKQAGRSFTVLTAVVLLVVGLGLAGNLIGGFFPTLGALVGTGAYANDGTDAEGGDNGADLDLLRDAGATKAKNGKGTVVHMKVTGRRTGLTRDSVVYLPPQYFEPAYRSLRFPAIEWIPNYPSGPEIADIYGLPDRLDAAIKKRAMPPTVVIVPDPTGTPKVGHDTECVDEVDGSPNDTYLSADVREWAIQRLGLNPDRRAWTIAGWSSGGYCALNMVTRHPQWFGQAVSVGGYDRAQGNDGQTDDLFHGRRDIDDANNVSINVRLHPSPVDILAVAGSQEHPETAAIGRIRAAAQSPVRVYSWEIPDAGHNMNTFKVQLPDVLAWIGERIPAPTAVGRPVDISGGVKPWPLPSAGARGGLTATQE
ncbi:alpha/beta hydrolase-fold protein [Amycolatopsis sp. PS_44_ISF1]|uniref:alpha/beta hydrolase n=1 Tax=Amycolatopsis sp. PS_44_ISF1 TaxID=2974917 RepID=UPI0028DF980C|nr:alpha/beta hydrolase-fold protein [Amycolatopsis sp. PS_44_ISF1]MDT8910175.1 alpha/beta hydrolase-fold protein [Amycolatopsis sp. PS_44_ISF1]